ncbi:hypothetical protein [Geitlerinema sp. PCC 9228]|jgi:hypothetical protein|uniref:hypothetical protein n=1 Tax=Geitlerinema sp. PCC 9228 TaxID=111611 RepID=UPI0008F9D31E|nr:hypothetical protein [Geitlerinema sp. PCC 9228]
MWIYFLGWFPMIAIAIANAGVRETWYGKHVKELTAHQISTISGILLFSLYIGTLVYFVPPVSIPQAIAIGGMWLVMTVAFEFLFGRYVAKHSWEKLLADYNILKGRLWLLVLVVIATAPYGFYRWLW